jgi:hypothetical protein
MRWSRNGRSSSRHNLALRLAAAAVTTVIASSALAQDAIKDGDQLSGELRLVRTRHPNGTRINAYQIVSAPRTMPTSDDFCDKPAKTFHIVATDAAKTKQLRSLVGRKVSLKADALFCSHTAWHIGDVMVSQWSGLTRR